MNLENQIKKLEKDLDQGKLSKYNSVMNELNLIYDPITEGLQIGSKWNWHRHGEKSTKFFLNLKKSNEDLKIQYKIVVDDKEITDQTHILEQITKF